MTSKKKHVKSHDIWEKWRGRHRDGGRNSHKIWLNYQKKKKTNPVLPVMMTVVRQVKKSRKDWLPPPPPPFAVRGT